MVFFDDGKPDLVSTNSSDGTVSVLLGVGGGTFQLPRTFPTGQGVWPVVVLDANGDGKLDIVTGNYGDKTITSLLGGGDGTFASATPANSVAPQSAPQAVDLNGDGVTDTVVLDRGGDILYRQGQGDGQFAPPQILNPTRPVRDLMLVQTPAGEALATADIDPDSALSSPGHPVYTVSIYALSAVGSVNRTVAFSTTRVPTRIAAADLTGNGLDDIVVANALDDTVQIAYQRADEPLDRAFRTVPLTTLPAGETPSEVTLADVNNDALLDIVVTNQGSGDVSIFLNDASHPFATQQRLHAGTAPRIVVTSSTISTVAGNNYLPYSGDGGPSVAATIDSPGGVSVDAAGNLFIADTDNNVIRKVGAGSGIILTVAGIGVAGHSGDGNAATTARLSSPSGVSVDAAGNLYIADTYNNVIRKVDAGTGIIGEVPQVWWTRS